VISCRKGRGVHHHVVFSKSDSVWGSGSADAIGGGHTAAGFFTHSYVPIAPTWCSESDRW